MQGNTVLKLNQSLTKLKTGANLLALFYQRSLNNMHAVYIVGNY